MYTSICFYMFLCISTCFSIRFYILLDIAIRVLYRAGRGTRRRPSAVACPRTKIGRRRLDGVLGFPGTPNLPTKIHPTKIIPTYISGKFHMGVRIPPLKIKILPELNPPKSSIVVRRLALVPMSEIAHDGPCWSAAG